MLTRAQEKLILSLHHKNGRKKSGYCLVEGEKNIEAAGDFVQYTFGPEDSPMFHSLVTTETPQMLAAVARIPQSDPAVLTNSNTIVILDGVQDPGNVGAIVRLCLGFDAVLCVVESADVMSPKVIRSSAGAVFQIPWIQYNRDTCQKYLQSMREANTHTIFRLEKSADAKDVAVIGTQKPAILIAGSEGNGISMISDDTSIAITHSDALESLNIGHAVAIALHQRYHGTLLEKDS